MEALWVLLGTITSNNAAWDVLKGFWQKIWNKSIDAIFIASFEKTVKGLKNELSCYSDNDEISIDKKALRIALHESMGLKPGDVNTVQLSSEIIIKKLAFSMCRRSVLIIGGNNLTEEEYLAVTESVVIEFRKAFIQELAKNEDAFRESVLNNAVSSTKIQEEILAVVSQLLEQKTAFQDVINTRDLQIERLEELKRESLAFCAISWESLGVEGKLAQKLANNPEVGRVVDNLLPTATMPFVVWVGEQGVGKTLLAHRIYQKNIEDALANPNTPTPAYYKARDLQNLPIKLLDKLRQDAAFFGQSQVTGIALVVDGLDEISSNKDDLLKELRKIPLTWPKTTVIVTSRHLPVFSASLESEQIISIDSMSEETTIALISTISQRKFTDYNFMHLSKPIRESVKLPLFAIMLATYFRRSYAGVAEPHSIGELIKAFVQQTITSDYEELLEILGNLAIRTTEKPDISIHNADIVPANKLKRLLESRLVFERDKNLYFTVPLFSQWFAALKLTKGEPKIESLLDDTERLEKWFYPLVILVSAFNFETASKYLEPIAQFYPGFASRVIHEALSRNTSSGDYIKPDVQDCGEKIIISLKAWIDSLAKLALYTAPVRDDSTLLPMGMNYTEPHINILWYVGEEKLPELTLLADDFSPGDFRNPNRVWDYYAGPKVTDQPNWAWYWTHNKLRDKIASYLESRSLYTEVQPHIDEECWRTALKLTGLSDFALKLPIQKIEESLSRYHPLTQAIEDSRTIPRKVYKIDWLRTKITELKRKGEEYYFAPWPQWDREPDDGWIWSGYSDSQLLKRVEVVYTAAFQIYKALVEEWFPNFKDDLSTYLILPVKLVGTIKIPKPESSPFFGASPIMSWHFEALPVGSPNSIELALLHVESADFDFDDDKLDRIATNYKKLRPKHHTRIQATEHSGALDIYGINPAVELAYQWLINDLYEVKWSKTSLLQPM